MGQRMRVLGAMAAGTALAGTVLAGCASGPVIHSTIGQGSKFCGDLSSFSLQAEELNNGGTLAALQSEVPAVHQALVTLAQEAPPADTVGGHLVKTDLNTEATAYGQLATALQQADPSDPNAAGDALKKVEEQSGGAVTDATGRLDDYAHKACGVNPTSVSGASGATTPVAPAGVGVTTTTS